MAAGSSWRAAFGVWLALLAALVLMLLSAYVAFGPGPRACSVGFSLGLVASGARAGELACRGAFGLGTLLALAMVLLFAAAALRRISPGRVAELLRKSGVGLAIAVLAPVLLAAALLALPMWIARWAVRRYIRPAGSGTSRS